MKLAATNLGVGLMSDLFQSSKRYKQILALGLVYWHKQVITRIDIFPLLLYEI